MKKSTEELRELLQKYLAGTASPEEQAFVENYYDHFEKEEATSALMSETEKGILAGRIMQRIDTEIALSETPVISFRRPSTKLPERIGTGRITWKRIAVAASVAITVGLGSYFAFFTNKADEPLTADNRYTGTDVLPGSYKAKLTLANGETIILDSAALGELIKQGNTSIINKDGQLVYIGEKQAANSEQPLYNTLSTSKGETYATVLADGSKVWLNSGSSIKYPVAFVGNERKVEITGEAYFEIAHDRTKPFIVSANDKADVKVLGTHFNVNTYDDEENIKVTLLEGSVKVSAKNAASSAIQIKPGEQAVVAAGNITTNKTVDLDQIMAWKNHQFIFDRDELPVIMRQLSRWYDVEVVYEGKLSAHKFSGIISRQRNASAVLEMLKATGSINFRIEGRRIIVLAN